MQIETTLSQGLRTTQGITRYDAACKSLLSEKIILAWIMKDCLDEFRDMDPREIAEKYIENVPLVQKTPVFQDEEIPPKIKGTNTEDKRIRERTVTFDIKFYAAAPVADKTIRLIMDVEAKKTIIQVTP